MITRRRFITISASLIAAAAVPKPAVAMWKGRAFGAEVSISLSGNSRLSQPTLDAARDTILRLENLFSLYDPNSSLSSLNRAGDLEMPPEFARLISLCTTLNQQTRGLFDPTVQPLFEALGRLDGQIDSQTLIELSSQIGWHHLHRTNNTLRFGKPGMAMTLNGIAQGFATDRVTEVLAAKGFASFVVNIGEFRVGATPSTIEIENLNGNKLGQAKLNNAAIATTSRFGYTFANGNGHILSPQKNAPESNWNTVSVVAESAGVADGLSTALALTPDTKLATELYEEGHLLGILAEDRAGDIFRLGMVG